MKELSIAEKAKRYDEAIEVAQRFYNNSVAITKKGLEDMFPVLAENEDERIRKKLLEYFKSFASKTFFNGVPTNDAIAWLEKQAGQRPADKVEPKFKNGQWIVWQDKCYKVNYNGCGYELVDQNGLSTSLEYGTIDENAHLWDVTKDAKDGDVLACNEEILLFKSYSVQGRISLYCWYNGQTNNFHDKEVTDTLLTTRNKICPATKEQRDLLFQKMKESGYKWDSNKKELKKIEDESVWSEEDKKMICCLHKCLEELSENNGWNYVYIDCEDIGIDKLKDWLRCLEDKIVQYPQKEWSTEDERILYNITQYMSYAKGKKSITESCYIEAEKWLKSLKDRLPDLKKWTEEDERMYRGLHNLIYSTQYCDSRKELSDFLNSLKDRVQPNKEWSEEDEERIKNILSVLGVQMCWNGATGKQGNPYQKEINWLKSLRPQSHWTPSDEQLDALHNAAVYVDKSMFPYPKGILMKLYKQLKKLKKE